jgi:hypothetical protein
LICACGLFLISTKVIAPLSSEVERCFGHSCYSRPTELAHNV